MAVGCSPGASLPVGSGSPSSCTFFCGGRQFSRRSRGGGEGASAGAEGTCAPPWVPSCAGSIPPVAGTLVLRLLSDGQGLSSRTRGDGFLPLASRPSAVCALPCGCSGRLRVPENPGLGGLQQGRAGLVSGK